MIIKKLLDDLYLSRSEIKYRLSKTLHRLDLPKPLWAKDNFDKGGKCAI